MPLTLAKTILSKEGGGAAILPWKAEDYEGRQEEWLGRCVRFSDVIEPVDQHEAFVDLSAHPRPESLLEKLLRELPEGTRYGVARAKWLARVACGAVSDLAYHDPSAFLDELPTSLLEPVSEESRFRLEFLGYRTAGEVALVPLETLKSQFDKEALVIWQAARGRAGEAVRALYPRAVLGERVCFESAVESREAIDAALDELARRVSEKLVDRDLQGSVLRLWVEGESFGGLGERECRMGSQAPEPSRVRLRRTSDRNVRPTAVALTDVQALDNTPLSPVEREFAKPMQSFASVRFALSLMCQPKEPVVSLRVQLPGLKAANRKQQRLYVARTDSQDTLEHAVGRVKKLYGEEVILRGSELKLPRRVMVLRAWKDATGWS